MNDEVDRIKERLDIVDVISSYLTMKKAGANFKANCPFHHEKSPSFMVSPERQTFKCFGCGQGGDVFTFIEQIEGVDFYNALKILADRAGVELKQKSVQRGQKEYKSDSKTRIFEINDWAKRLYHKILIDHPKAESARKYLEKRKMTKGSIIDFEIGYAPESWDLLIKFLKGKGYTEEEMVQAGVAVRNDRGGAYDRFRGRIMFPINNIMGSTVAFTSRILDSSKDQAKYLNSAESPIYTKGKILYGLDKAKLHIKEADMAVFVEGNMDVIACHQAGFKNVVATSGTAITEDQLKILNRYGSTIAFCFDSDEAGVTAMKKAITIALRNDIATKVIALPEAFKDPDEAIEQDPKHWRRAVEAAKPALEYWIDLLVRKNPDLGVLAKKTIAKEILPVIKTIYSDIEKEYYISYLAKKLSVSEKALISSLDKTKESEDRSGKKDEEISPVKLTIEEKMLGILFRKPEYIKIIDSSLDDYEDKRLSNFLGMIKSREIVRENIPSDELTILSQLEMSILEYLDPTDEEAIKSELSFLAIRSRSEKTESLKNDFAIKIQEAEKAGDIVKLKKLLQEFSNLIK